MDFIMGLPMPRGFDVIFVVVDMLTKLTHLFPIHKDYSTKDVSRVFMKDIFLHHVLSINIISDPATLRSHQVFGRPYFKLQVLICIIV